MSTPTEALVGRLRAALATRGGDPAEVLVHEEALPARPPSGAVLRPQLPKPLGDALRRRGLRILYEHQVASVQHARAGRDVVVTTPTASGKTLCFNLPVVERAIADHSSRALYLYPTKALANDQLRGLETLLADVAESGGPALRAARLDGDVDFAERDRLRADPPNVLLANPDIVHHDLLLRHRRWGRFLAGLRFIVLDELHAYRGVFGAHVALILRRLLRLAEGYGARPTIVAASATIGNPAELAERLTGREFAVVSGDGAGACARRFILWRPPKREGRFSRSTLTESVALFDELLRAGRTAILFGQSRVAVERMLALARQDLPPNLAELVSAYKSGYTAEERAEIEARLREGKLRGVIATNALELGIDIGSLDAAVLAGYPGSVMSTWQQAGRVGRREGDEALIILVGAEDALDQYYLSHPGAFFGQTAEEAVVDPGNEGVLLPHLLCAAYESPLADAELARFPDGAKRAVSRLVKEGLLTAERPRRVADPSETPHRSVGIRGVRRDQYRVLDGSRLVCQIEPPYLDREAFPGAVYLHQGEPYRVLAVDDVARVVRVRREPGEVRTDPLSEVDVAPRGEAAESRVVRLGEAKLTLAIGPVSVTETIAEYRETAVGSRRPLTRVIDPPRSSTLETVGLWLDLPPTLRAADPALHAFEHALVHALPVALLCDRRDMGSTCDVAASLGGRVYLYDGYEGGTGLAEKAFGLFERLAETAIELLSTCRCAEGCPSCVHLAGCGRGNEDLDKVGALSLLRGEALIWREPAVASSTSRADREGVGAGSTRGGRQLDQLRRLAEESLRERLARMRQVAPGDELDYPGYGRVTVVEVSSDRARIRFRGSSALMWVPFDQLKRPS